MMWKVKKFNELSVNELYKIMYLRVATFVVEQDRVYQEIDQDDLKAIHVFKEDHDGEIVAYGRILPVDNDTVTFGRVVTSQKVRGKGVGKELLQEIMQAIKEYFPNKKIEIHAQVQVKGYYQQAGLSTEGDEFIFESTPHIKMVHDKIK